MKKIAILVDNSLRDLLPSRLLQKEFNRNGNIYSGMGPADSLVSYGLHNINFDKASFTVVKFIFGLGTSK